jgi:ABC-type Fe3+-siderophore transport system permease subunit
MLWFAFEINGVTSGSMLGVFLLGIFTKKRYRVGYVIFSMIFSSLLCLFMMIGNRLNYFNIPWSSFVLIGTFISFLLPQILNYMRKDI